MDLQARYLTLHFVFFEYFIFIENPIRLIVTIAIQSVIKHVKTRYHWIVKCVGVVAVYDVVVVCWCCCRSCYLLFVGVVVVDVVAVVVIVVFNNYLICKFKSGTNFLAMIPLTNNLPLQSTGNSLSLSLSHTHTHTYTPLSVAHF